MPEDPRRLAGPVEQGGEELIEELLQSQLGECRVTEAAEAPDLLGGRPAGGSRRENGLPHTGTPSRSGLLTTIRHRADALCPDRARIKSPATVPSGQ